MKFDNKAIEKLNSEFGNKSPQDILEWSVKEMGNNIALATSFQAQGMVLIDMLMKIDNNARIFTVDTGRLNPDLRCTRCGTFQIQQ